MNIPWMGIAIFLAIVAVLETGIILQMKGQIKVLREYLDKQNIRGEKLAPKDVE